MKNKISISKTIADVFVMFKYADLGDGIINSNVKLILRNWILTRLKPMKGLKTYEVAFLYCLTVQPRSCDKLARQFALFWEDDVEQILLLENEIYCSQHNGPLSKYALYSAGYWKIKSSQKQKILKSMLGGQ